MWPNDPIEVILADDQIGVSGFLNVPPSARGLIIFAHGSGSGRLSPRNQGVAEILTRAGFATLLFDLLTDIEAQHRPNVFDIPLLATRLKLAVRWAKIQQSTKHLPIGLFGSSTGAAAALWAAADLKHQVSAVVSRGGRPDLALPRLKEVTAPTLLLVGGWDEPVIEMNREAEKQLKHGKLIVIPEATHLFEEPGKLEAVAHEAAAWFTRYVHRGKAQDLLSIQ